MGISCPSCAGLPCDISSFLIFLSLRALVKRPDLCCLWKIVGDACFVLHVLPGESLTLKVPDALSRLIKLTLKGSLTTKEEILELSWR